MHEINNPLSFVYNNVVVLERDAGAPRFATYIQEAEPFLARELPT